MGVKTALITGASGFIGHHLIEFLARETDWNLIGLDRCDSPYLERRSKFTFKALDDRQRSRIGFIQEDLLELSSRQIQSWNPDVIFHLAAESHVTRSIADPMGFAQNNVIGTVKLLELSRELKNLERFVYFSTDEVFGPAPEGAPFSEYDRYNSTNPYSASKAAAEEFCVAFHNTYGTPVVVLHLMNVFGERQHPEKYIPKVLAQIQNSEEITIHVDEGGAPLRRHFVDVRDICAVALFIVRAGNDIVSFDPFVHCPKINLVGPEEIDCLTLAKQIAQCSRRPLLYKLQNAGVERPGYDVRYALRDHVLKKFQKSLQSRLSVRLPEIVDWTLQNQEWLNEVHE